MQKKGKLLIIGGGEVTQVKSNHFKSTLLKEIFPYLNSKKITVVTEGGPGLNHLKKKYISVFEKLTNIKPQFVVLRRNHHNDKDIYKERLQQADSIFLSGGDQEHLLKLLSQTSLISLIKKRFLKTRNSNLGNECRRHDFI